MSINNRLGKGCGPRPHIWITGPDEKLHDQYYAFLRQKAQANFRKEGWEMEFEEFLELWDGKWDQRGRASEDLCMTRNDYDLPWAISNVTIVPRHEHVKRSWMVKIARGQTGPRHKRKLKQNEQ